MPSTLAPTFSPSHTKPDQLDLYVILDNSNSMTWHYQVCAQSPGADLSLPNDLMCWGLFIGFVRSLANEALALGTLSWQGDLTNPSKGLRVTVLAFSCTDQQTVPVTFQIGLNLNTQASFDAALQAAMALVPTGGTCPGQTIDMIVNMIQNDPLALSRPIKSSILITDGIFYDEPRPAKAAQGLTHFCVQTYALVRLSLVYMFYCHHTARELITRENCTIFLGSPRRRTRPELERDKSSTGAAH